MVKDSGWRTGRFADVDDVSWLQDFLDYVKEKKLPLDFVSRHHYTSYVPDRVGHYGYIDLHDPDDAFSGLEKSREIVDSYEEFAGKDIHITEYNTSYIPNAPVHDTCYNAAYVAHMLSRLGDCHTSYSYWTFGDVFEELGDSVYSVSWWIWTGSKWLYSKADVLDICFL